MFTEIDKRMKRYEEVNKYYLTRKMPVIIRIDGKAFHTFTKGLTKPFDEAIVKSMQKTMLYLCNNIQCCKLGYVQSDEISLLLTDYDEIKTEPWFNNEVNKINSICASMATLEFNRQFKNYVDGYANSILSNKETSNENDFKLLYKYNNCINKGALFDCRCFNLPKEEVCNYFIWRQQDATRNSILSVGYANFSHKELMNLTVNQIQEKLFQERMCNWNDFNTIYKRGTTCKKIPVQINDEVIRNKFILDFEMPILTKDRNYIEELL